MHQQLPQFLDLLIATYPCTDESTTAEKFDDILKTLPDFLNIK